MELEVISLNETYLILSVTDSGIFPSQSQGRISTSEDSISVEEGLDLSRTIEC